MSTSKPTSPPVDGPRVVTRVKRSILPIAFLLYATSYMDRSSIGYAQLGMSQSLGIDIATFGVAASIFFIAYVLLEAPSNIILAKVGARLWLSRIAVTWGLVTMLTGFVWDVPSLYVARVLLGIAEAGLFPGLLLFLSLWFLQQDRGRALAAMVFAQPVALLAGSLSGGWIIDNAHWFGLQPWQWVFILQGLVPVLVGIYVFLVLPDRPSKARWLSPSESSWLEAKINAENAAVAATEGAVKHRFSIVAFKSPRVIALTLMTFFGSVGNYALAFFLPQVLKQIYPAYSATNIGFVGALPYILAGIAMLFFGRASDRAKSRRSVVILCLVIGLMGLSGTIAFQGNPVMQVVSLCVAAIGIVSYSPPMWAFITELLTPRQRVVVLAIMTSIASFGGFVGPLLIGQMAAGSGVIVAFIVPAICLAIAIVLLAFVRPQHQRTSAAAATPAQTGDAKV
ncbi:MFS transporter [Pseudarthrobacter phenanthrenivorans]|uniref:MFS transporter n=1 Tax=Pseudarthrobacter phenanthrenivorans TaxID=361575 RepID=A0A0B4CVW3_PSEPS|nr:MFS transporter [Pseudarthrobacter phenanthrenivorans]KIC65294.1 MFS transporter [Pseudarthrobacter phenanthrenivorans]